METPHSSGEYQIQTPTHPTSGADIPVGYTARLWIKIINLRPGGIQRRVDEISKQFTGAGWKHLPQELMDEILGYLLDDLRALKAFSLTCKRLLGATRPLIHQRLVCSDTRLYPPAPKRSLFSRRTTDPGAFGLLLDAARSGVLHYTRHLTFKQQDGTFTPPFVPQDLQEYLPQLRSITRLHSLTLDKFDLSPFIPVFDEHFGMFTDTVRHLNIRRSYGAERDLLYIISQFNMLEDLTLVSPPDRLIVRPEHHIPTITQSPPLRGKLVLAGAPSRELPKGLAALPGGLNFRSLELSCCTYPQDVLTACGRTATSISYLWERTRGDSEPHPFIQHVVV